MSVRNQANLFFATEQFKAAVNLLGFAGSTVFTILAISAIITIHTITASLTIIHDTDRITAANQLEPGIVS